MGVNLNQRLMDVCSRCVITIMDGGYIIELMVAVDLDSDFFVIKSLVQKIKAPLQTTKDNFLCLLIN